MGKMCPHRQQETSTHAGLSFIVLVIDSLNIACACLLQSNRLT